MQITLTHVENVVYFSMLLEMCVQFMLNNKIQKY